VAGKRASSIFQLHFPVRHFARLRRGSIKLLAEEQMQRPRPARGMARDLLPAE
jgi:hypothetical protein